MRVCGAELQPEGALPLLEQAERLAGDPVVAAPPQVPAGRFGAERSVRVGNGAAFRQPKRARNARLIAESS